MHNNARLLHLMHRLVLDLFSEVKTTVQYLPSVQVCQDSSCHLNTKDNQQKGKELERGHMCTVSIKTAAVHPVGM